MMEQTLGGKLRPVHVAAVVLSAFALVALHTSSAQAARGFETGFYEPDYASSDTGIQSLAFDRTAQARAGFALIYVPWNGVAPYNFPLGFDPSNPADPSYSWSAIDAAVRDASARGLKVLLAVTRAPSWAEGPGRPSQDQAPAGTWKPDPAALGEFTHAIATRYSGKFEGLPAVRYWQLWAEPNLAINLSPQFEGNTPVGFDVYRPMLNVFYDNLKAVSQQNVVITGGTAPYGGLTPARGLTFQRMQPLQFWRGLLCLQSGKRKKGKKKGKKGAAAARKRGGRLIPLPCPDPAKFDVVAHHPINVGAPTRPAINPDDVSTPDLWKLKRIVNAAVASGRALPGGPKPLWATEIWWNSNPPGRGVSLKTQARYLSQSFYILWKQRVQAVFWFELRDLQPNGRDPIPTSGVLFRDGRPKPSFTAFSFPFAAERLSRTRVRVWGMAPGAGPVRILSGRHRVKTLSASGNRVFVGIIRLRHRAKLRAVQGSQRSLVWAQS
jgi:hypothetical protein